MSRVSDCGTSRPGCEQLQHVVCSLPSSFLRSCAWSCRPARTEAGLFSPVQPPADAILPVFRSFGIQGVNSPENGQCSLEGVLLCFFSYQTNPEGPPPHPSPTPPPPRPSPHGPLSCRCSRKLSRTGRTICGTRLSTADAAKARLTTIRVSGSFLQHVVFKHDVDAWPFFRNKNSPSHTFHPSS